MRRVEPGTRKLSHPSKRALIVDDSRSARAFLSRILEHYHIEVDTAESGEHAIAYLGARRPDVIFMDHLMPGMDGFQAVRAIKNDPRTATIPIMMYTSEEGELYLGQARALGAAGVLPKQIKPADVSKLLYELHLVPERRSYEPSPLKPVVVEPAADASAARALTDSTLREQFAELRRTLIASLDTQSERIAADLRCVLQDALRSHEPARVDPPLRPWGWVAIACLSLLGVLASTALWWNEVGIRRQMDARIVELAGSLAAARASQRQLETELFLAEEAVLESAAGEGSFDDVPAITAAP
jgi:CheY-like chemotaxis protein